MKNKFLFLIILEVILFNGSCTNFSNGDKKVIYFPNSDIIKQIVELKNGKRVGELQEFYRNGNLKIKQHYKNDTLNDSAIFYHENGNIKYIQYLKDFKKEGIWKKYNESGQLYEEVSFKDDYLNGVTKKYTYRTLKLIELSNFEDGLKHGIQEQYYNNGKIKAKCLFYKGNPCEGIEEWDEGGHKINNDFKIYVNEQNHLMLENKLSYIITLENASAEDEIYVVTAKDFANFFTKIYPIVQQKRGEFVVDYNINKGGFIMEILPIAVYRKTGLGNFVVKTKSIVVSANNY